MPNDVKCQRAKNRS